MRNVVQALEFVAGEIFDSLLECALLAWTLWDPRTASS
jgi:hypothetical protein